MYYNRKVALTTLGCKLNFSETSAIGRKLTEHGFQVVPFTDLADFYIINTCSVTENADKQTKSIIKSALKTNAEAKLVIIGCYAQLKPAEIAAISGVSMVLGANEKFNLHTYLIQLEEGENQKIFAGEIDKIDFFSPAYSLGERTRSFLKIQDGCDYKCSFCTIPLARGKSRSASIDKTVLEAKKLAESGVKEIVIAGVNIGDFGKSPDGLTRTEENFFQLVQEFDKIEGIERWRISSIEPNLLTPALIDFVAKSTHFQPHFHIPLQSGNDKILKLMRRKYLTALYRERVDLIRAKIPEACIGVDVIVGFPGETEQDFLDTYQFINELEISYLHVFTYSERDNTRALDYDQEPIPIPIRKERNEMLRILSEKKKQAFYQTHIGTTRNVLWESENEEGGMYGFTDNYIKVCAPFLATKINTVELVKLKEIKNGFVVAERMGKAII